MDLLIKRNIARLVHLIGIMISPVWLSYLLLIMEHVTSAVVQLSRPGRCWRASSSCCRWCAAGCLGLPCPLASLPNTAMPNTAMPNTAKPNTANWPSSGEMHKLTLLHHFTAAPTQSHTGSSNEARQAVTIRIRLMTQTSLLQYLSNPSSHDIPCILQWSYEAVVMKHHNC